MPSTTRGLLRDNLFLVAAGALPLVVIAFFLASTIVPAWLVDPPAYDLVLKVTGPYDSDESTVSLTFEVADGQVVAVARPKPPNTYPRQAALFVFDHESLMVREVAVPRPAFEAEAGTDQIPAGAVHRFVVADLASRRAIAGAVAPDGYSLGSPSGGGTGLVGEIFGMRRSGGRPRLVKGSRVAPFELPSGYALDVAVVAWLAPEGAR